MLSLGVIGFIVGINSITALASTAPGLGTASTYAVLGGTTVTSTGNTVLTGDLGIWPGTACSGFPAPCTGGPGTVSGTIRAGGAQALQAQSDLTTAYGVAAASPCNSVSLAAWGGQTLTPGTYCQTTSPTISGTLTLSGNGVFIFKTGSTLVTAPGATVAFINGAQPCNVFWQVSSSATLDTTTSFIGTIMALTSITVNNGATIQGRLLARNGQVSLINDHVTVPTTCNAVTVAGPTPVPTVAGAPNGGGGPPQNEGFPWALALIAGVFASAGAVGLGLTVRGSRRT
jgi:Ice-binding-like